MNAEANPVVQVLGVLIRSVDTPVNAWPEGLEILTAEKDVRPTSLRVSYLSFVNWKHMPSD